MICTVGDLLEDVVVWLPRAPRRGSDTPVRVERRRGGSAANVAVFAAALGRPTRFVGQVGDDPAGRALVDQLAGAGVDPVVTHVGRSGAIVVLVTPDGERTMLTDRGTAVDLVRAPDGALDGVTWLHVPAYSLTVGALARAALELLAEAARRGIPVSVDASSVALLEDHGPAAFAELVARLGPQVLFANHDEAAALGLRAGRPAPGVALTVVKGGASPTLLVRADGVTASVPVPPVAEVVDTTGAGDAFAAAFVDARLAGHGPSASAQAGHRLAARVLRVAGASLGADDADRGRRRLPTPTTSEGPAR